MKKILNLIISGFVFLASFVPFLTVVNAEGETSNFRDDYEFRLNKPSGNYTFTGIKNGKTVMYNLTGTAGANDLTASTSTTPVYALRLINPSQSSSNTVLFYYYDEEYWSTDGTVNFRFMSSSDGLNWSRIMGQAITSQYQYNTNGTVGKKIYYRTFVTDMGPVITYGKDIPLIRYNENTNINTVLAAISLNSSSPYPWNSTTNDGTMTFPDGTTLSPQNVTKYEQVFVIMDVNHDNSVSQEEVNYYNVTYNTDYDYTEINDGNDFTELEFLYYIALQILNGNDNPGGGSGTGGGDNAMTGGITVTDSFTQSQTQSIAENAVNVSIVNDGSVNNQNVQWINSIINNTLSGSEEENAFENAIGTVGNFIQLGQSFALLASAVLSFLPGWLLTLLSLMFSVLFVMVVFRLIHLFI